MVFGAAVPTNVLDQAAANDPSITAVSFSGNALWQMKSNEYCARLGEALKMNTNITEVMSHKLRQNIPVIARPLSACRLTSQTAG